MIQSPSEGRQWLAAQGIKAEGAADPEIMVALQSLLAPRPAAAEKLPTAYVDPLSRLGKGGARAAAASAEASWVEVKRRAPAAILRKPVGMPVAKAFETTMDLLSEEVLCRVLPILPPSRAGAAEPLSRPLPCCAPFSHSKHLDTHS